jgi:hypothetical protein
MHLKKYSRIKIFVSTQGAPCVVKKFFFLESLFNVYFVTNVSLYFWNLRKILHILIPMKSIFLGKNFGPLYSAWPKRSLGPKIFFCDFRYFWKVCNKPQGYFCWKCKKSPKSTHPIIQYAIPLLLKGSEVKYHLTHKMTNTLHNYPVMLYLRRICHSG